ncbi:bifunctional phosphoribosylaminoimidazolecarboxamide formyltransferase/IMP cyclohydrolase, partial [bacterium]|nr:bifunctional phosphoribosylaminoimidazolecarboxamide formyltransferase/IMP cyclohydrolase [bacterium]
TMVRAAAKNHKFVAVVTDPAQYETVLAEMRESDGETTLGTRQMLAVEAFEMTCRYDAAISAYLREQFTGEGRFPTVIAPKYLKLQELRYGENPHQNAAFYRCRPRSKSPGVPSSEQLSGKELSYNNIMDLDAALAVVREFDEPAAAVIKHATPCGVATAATLDKAYERALACDPMSAFGSVIALNRSVDMATAKLIHGTHFVEAVIAPDYYRNALELICGKKNRRIVRAPFPDVTEYHLKPERHMRSLGAGGLLIQDLDVDIFEKADLRTVTEREPTPEELHSLLFAWRAVKHIRSNAIVLVTGTETIGIGAGQMSRVDASILAVWKAGDRVKGSVMASDAFFPMRDAVDAAAEAGVTAIIQPGGSKGDPDVIKAANERQIAMIMTGQRHFKH